MYLDLLSTPQKNKTTKGKEFFMSLIQIPAFAIFCSKCGKHGNIVLADGTVGKEFFSKDGARKQLDELCKKSLLTEHEFKFLSSQISDSDMDMKDDPLVRIMNDIEALHQELMPGSDAPKDEVPPGYVM